MMYGVAAQMLRPVQKNASRLFLAGTQSAVDVRERPLAETPGPPTVLYAAQGEAGPRRPLPASPPRQSPSKSKWQASGRLPVEVQEPATSCEGSFYSRQASSEGSFYREADYSSESMQHQQQQMMQHFDFNAAQCDGVARWPVGSMVLPVFWPVASPAAHQQQFWGALVEVSGPMLDMASSGSTSHLDQALASCVSPSSPASGGAPALPEQPLAPLPGRTGASRRQRRKQRSALMAAAYNHAPRLSQAPTTPASVQQHSDEAPKAAKSPELQRSPSVAALEDSGPSMLWPPTPESSPNVSPRQRAEEFLPDFHLPATAQALANLPANLPAVASAGQLADADLESVAAHLVAGESSTRSALLAWLADGAVWPLATMPSGCRVVQQALEVAEGAEQAALAEQLRGHVREASMSPHANHVLQKCIELMPPDRLSFVLTEMKGHTVNAARHRYGCRVLERLIEHCPSWQTDDLVEELLVAASQLCRHTFGNFVIQHVLEHGTPLQRQRIAEVLHADVQRLARHRVASHVVRSALVHCSPDDRQRLVDAMQADAGELSDLAHHHCGSFVVREMRRELRK